MRILPALSGSLPTVPAGALRITVRRESNVKVSLTIDATGKVPKSIVKSATVSDPNVGTCIAKAVKRWKFPKPRGGAKVEVTYPFVLTPG